MAEKIDVAGMRFVHSTRGGPSHVIAPKWYDDQAMELTFCGQPIKAKWTRLPEDFEPTAEHGLPCKMCLTAHQRSVRRSQTRLPHQLNNGD